MRYRFEIALSFAGENRELIRQIAAILATALTPKRIFFDEWYETEIAGHDAQIILQQIYCEQSRVVVPFISKRYNEKPWTQDEWRAIQTLERQLRDAASGNVKRLRLFPLRVEDGDVDGAFPTAIIPDVRHRPAHITAQSILKRLDLYRQRTRLKPWNVAITDSTKVDGEEDAVLKAVAGRTWPFALDAKEDETSRPRHSWLTELEAILSRQLHKSVIAPLVLTELRGAGDLQPTSGYDWFTLITGIRASDEYFVRVATSAGDRDWQRDVAQVATPTIVGVAQAFERSFEAQSNVIRLCNAIAERLRLEIDWPDDADEYNDVVNSIYEACRSATSHGSDEVLMELKGLRVIGPR
jgi:hypothetical protein